MGLYLAVFDGDKELDGVEVGHYSDFGVFRDAVLNKLEPKGPGTRFPTLMLHSDCDGEWTPKESVALISELEEIAACFKKFPPADFHSEWQRTVAKTLGIKPKTLYECFIDVDGEPLLERLISLAHVSSQRQLPIMFQ